MSDVARPRLLVIMGSGETSPTMAPVHRDLIGRLGADAEAVVLDTPAGFQLNAAELAAKAVDYFARSVGHPAAVASLRDASAATSLEHETMLHALRSAAYVFAGPGSPTYALRQWIGSPVPDVLRDKLKAGGCVTFASAAALTLGRYTIPVYEIYKAGADVHWESGLDLLIEAGLVAAVVPHYNNREGGTHDTRYCYMGEARLEILEAMLPPDTLVLGVDEHTACIIDIATDTAEVVGIGAVTVRRAGAEIVYAPGAVVGLDEVRAAQPAGSPLRSSRHDGGGTVEPRGTSPGFWPAVERQRARFTSATAVGDVAEAVDAVLALDEHVWEWSTETFGTDELQRARAAMRDMIAVLSSVTRPGSPAARAVVAPVVEALLALRRRLRGEGRFAFADALRSALADAGIDVRDRPDGSDWVAREEPR